MEFKLCLAVLLALPAFSLAALGDIYEGCGDAKECYDFGDDCIGSVRLNTRPFLSIEN